MGFWIRLNCERIMFERFVQCSRAVLQYGSNPTGADWNGTIPTERLELYKHRRHYIIDVKLRSRIAVSSTNTQAVNLPVDTSVSSNSLCCLVLNAWISGTGVHRAGYFWRTSEQNFKHHWSNYAIYFTWAWLSWQEPLGIQGDRWHSSDPLGLCFSTAAF